VYSHLSLLHGRRPVPPLNWHSWNLTDAWKGESHGAIGARMAGGHEMKGPDPTAPDLDGARRRYPNWTFWRAGVTWLARRDDGTCQLDGLSLESLEGKVTRAEKRRLDGTPSPPRGWA